MLRRLLALAALTLLQAPAVFMPYEDVAAPRIASDGWPAWVAKRDAEIRARLARGDEDSLVYLWLYGTSFTRHASMLRPGGIFLTNYAVAPSAQMEGLPQLTARVFFDDQGNGDSVFCYQRR